MKVVVASANQGKIVEVERLLGQLDIEVISMRQAGIAADLPEDGRTFAANALSKARALSALAPAGCNCLGDDSGLEVDALGGAPGVYSARWAGVDARGRMRDQANNEKLLAELRAIAGADRTARFVCCMALAGPGDLLLTARGTCEGRILTTPRGTNGFGYDPLFLPDGFDRTMAELSIDEKNRISHRGRALRALVDEIRAAGHQWLSS